METEIILEEKVKLKDPILVVGLTGIGNVGRTAVSYLIGHLKAKKFGTLYSPHFPHIAIVNENGEMELLKNEFYYHHGKKDVILMTGHTQSISPEGHYEIAYKVVEFAKQLGVKDIITIGGFGSGEIVEKPAIYGIASDSKLEKNYSKTNIKFDHNVGEVIGASGLFIGVGKRMGINGVCLLGETPGFLLSDPKATEEILKVLEKILKIKVDYKNLNEKVKELEKVIRKIQKLQGEIMRGQPQTGKSEKDLTYIG